MVKFESDWDDILSSELQQAYLNYLLTALETEYAEHKIYPPKEEIFAALRYTSFASTKVVILGQDPYHGAGQAHGLCFSVKKYVKLPPSLKNIFKELQNDIGCTPPKDGTLTNWAKQGVLLLNTTLTVREGQPASHKKLGWQTFTDAIISKLSAREKPIVFLLWGAHAQAKRQLISAPQHLILECAHPSPLSANQGFFGCRHFSKCNKFLIAQGINPIEWDLS